LTAKPIELQFRLAYTLLKIKYQWENKMPSRKKTRKVNPQKGDDEITVKKKVDKRVVAAGRGSKARISRMDTVAEAKKWRKDMEKRIDANKDLLPADKTDLKENIVKVADEVSKGRQADSSRLERLLNVIGSIAPDIFDVAITTLANPLAGLGLVAKKIGERAKLAQQTSS
jgi:hypothetical protein